jgi:hypothetical protein
MRIRFVVVVLVVFFLAACSSPKTPIIPETLESPLFTDVDLNGATFKAFTTTSVESSNKSEVELSSTSEIDLSSSSESAFSPQAVLPGSSGVIAYIRYTPTTTNPYAILLFNQTTDVATVVYAGKREIDSVAVDGAGTKVVFSARQTTNPASDFEVYQLVLTPKTVTALTNNTNDDTNVSVSGDASIIAWEGLSTTSTRQVQWLETATSTLRTLNSTVNDTMPSISGNGAYIAFIRTLSTGAIRVYVYQLSNATLTSVISNTIPKKHPSVTDDKGKVAWTETTATTTRVLVRNTTTGVSTITVNNAAGVEHAHLRKDGKFLTYGLLESGKWQLYTRDLTTNTSLKNISSTTADAKGMFWSLPPTPGSLDTSFGTGGIVTSDANDGAGSGILDSSGRIVVVGGGCGFFVSSSIKFTVLVLAATMPVMS